MGRRHWRHVKQTPELHQTVTSAFFHVVSRQARSLRLDVSAKRVPDHKGTPFQTGDLYSVCEKSFRCGPQDINFMQLVRPRLAVRYEAISDFNSLQIVLDISEPIRQYHAKRGGEVVVNLTKSLISTCEVSNSKHPRDRVWS
jgi:hypothetical protein